MEPNNKSQLSTRLQVKPLKEGEIKTFKLCGSGNIDPNVRDEASGKNLPAHNGGADFVGYFTIYDKYEPIPSKRKKVLKNVTGTYIEPNKDTGKDEEREVLENITFNSKGICVVKHDEYTKMVCLMRANENASNPYRDKSKPAVWEELNANENAALAAIISDGDLAFEAENIARKGDIKDCMAISKKLFGSINPDPKDLRQKLVNEARSNPKGFIRASKDKDMRLKIQIDDAMKMRLLDLNENEEWVWMENDGKDILLVKVDVSKDPYVALIEFINTDKEFATKLSKHVDVETTVAA